MEAQGSTRPAMLPKLVGLAQVVPLDHVFIHVLDQGYLAAAYVCTIST